MTATAAPLGLLKFADGSFVLESAFVRGRWVAFTAPGDPIREKVPAGEVAARWLFKSQADAVAALRAAGYGR